jgi:HD-like signal output (HDOD) protein
MSGETTNIAAHAPASMAAFDFVRELASELTNGSIELPSFPEVAVRVQRILLDENTTSERVVRALGAEPVMAARVLTLANSAAMNPIGPPVTELRAAVARLGFDAMRTAVISFAMAQVQKAKGFRGIERHLAVLCNHSALVASMCYVLARRSGKLNPDTAMLTGLVHGVGKLYILTHAARHPALLGDHDTYQDVVRDWHANVAKALLDTWYMAEEIVAAVHSYEDEERDTRGSQGLLTDVLAMAELISVCKEVPDVMQQRVGKTKAAARLGLNFDSCRTIIVESAGELAALKEALAH